MNNTIRIGTRGSKLALWQANHINELLTSLGHSTQIVVIKTQGDKIQNVGFEKMEGKGFFTKELEEALLAKDVDLAVHSMKDLPTEGPDNLILGAVSKRANPSDLLIIAKDAVNEDKILKLKANAKIGTSSLRRKSQIENLVPGVEVLPLRGNVPTRVQKLADGQYDAIILAKAGLDRLELNLSNFETIELNPREFVPAPAQGVMAYQMRSDDLELRKLFADIHDVATGQCTNIERKVLNMMQGGCQLPLGVYCYRDVAGNYHVNGALFKGDQLHRSRVSQSTSVGLAEKLFENLNNA